MVVTTLGNLIQSLPFSRQQVSDSSKLKPYAHNLTVVQIDGCVQHYPNYQYFVEALKLVFHSPIEMNWGE